MSLARLVVTAVLVERRPKAVVARDYGVSRRWVHELVRRFLAEGEAGLEPRSRRPRTSPHRICDHLENEIVQVRKHLADAGLDAGAHTIAVHLERRHGTAPAVSTIWRSFADAASSPRSRRSDPGARSSGSRRRCPTSAGRPTSPTGPSGTAPAWRS
jgi:hypothetical protein